MKNSPIHYIALPPNPYSFIPGLGFLSPASKPSFPLPLSPSPFLPPSSSISSSSKLPSPSLPLPVSRDKTSDKIKNYIKYDIDNVIPDHKEVNDVLKTHKIKKMKKKKRKKKLKKKKLKPSKIFTYKMPSYMTLTKLEKIKDTMVNMQERDILRPKLAFVSNGKPHSPKVMKDQSEKNEEKLNIKEEVENVGKEEDDLMTLMKPSKIWSIKEIMSFQANGKPNKIYELGGSRTSLPELEDSKTDPELLKAMERSTETSLKTSVQETTTPSISREKETLRQSQKLATSIGRIIGNLISRSNINKKTTTEKSSTEGSLDRIFSDSISVSRIITRKPVRRKINSFNSPIKVIKIPHIWNLNNVFENIMGHLSASDSYSTTTTTTTSTTTTTTTTTKSPLESLLPRHSPLTWISGLTNGLPSSLIHLPSPAMPNMSWIKEKIKSSLLPAARMFLG